jgi:hypothetical protein
MQLKSLMAALAIICFSAANAQVRNVDILKNKVETDNRDTVAWMRGGSLNIGINEGFLHNWPAGGELASLTINSTFSGYTVHQHHRHIWSNYLDLNYGLFYANSNYFVPRKVDDRIDFSSKYSYRLDTAKDFFLAALFNFKSQFTKAYDYTLPDWDTMATSKFLSPAYFTLAPGLEYRQGAALQIFFSPIASRVTIANKRFTSRDPDGAFGITYGETSRYEFGALFSGRYQVNISKSLSYKTRLDLYGNYLAKDVKDSTGVVVKSDNPGNVDVMWDNLFTLKISKFFNASLGITAIYDDNIPYEKTYTDENGKEVLKDEPGQSLGWVQMKQILTLGIVYKF